MGFDDSSSTEYSLDFEDNDDEVSKDSSFNSVHDDDQSESDYLPNVKVSPILMDESSLMDGKAGKDEQVEDNAKDNSLFQPSPDGVSDGVISSTLRVSAPREMKPNKASVEEVVDTLLRMHPTSAPNKTNEEHTKDEAVPVEEWRDAFDAKTRRTYYYNRRTRETRWKLPANAILVPRKAKKSGHSFTPKADADAMLAASLSSSHIPQRNGGSRGSDPNVIGGDTGTDDKDNGKTTDAIPHLTASTNNLTPSQNQIYSPPAVSRELLTGRQETTGGVFPNKSGCPSRDHFRPTFDSAPYNMKNLCHPIYCLYCASRCESPGGLADHLLGCETYMNILAKHPRVQKELEEMMLKTWGIERAPPLQSGNDSFDARFISNDDGTSLLDVVASPSIVDRMTPASTTARSSTGKWTPPPSAPRPVTATSADYMYRFNGSDNRSKSLVSPPNYATGEQILENTAEEEEYLSDQDDDSPYKSECAFCGRSFENLSKHLLRCKHRQRTQERRKAMSATPRRSSRPPSIQSVLSGGRALPGHPKESSSRLDARRLDYR